MSRFEQIKSHKSKRIEKLSDRVHAKPGTRMTTELIHETTKLVHVIDGCIGRELRPSSTWFGYS